MSVNQLPLPGDPFAMAYAQGGNVQQAARSETSRLTEADAAASRERYTGYGFQAPASSCPPGPEDALVSCVRALESILKQTIQRTESVPYHAPPYHARPFCDYTETVLSTTVALNAATNAAGLLLLAANTVAGSPAFVPALEEMVGADSWRPIYTLDPQQGYMARIKAWGVDFGPAGPKSVILRVRASTVAGASPQPPNPFLSGFTADQQEDTFVVLNSKQTLVVEARLRDVTAGPVLVRFGSCGWSWPVNKRVDGREGTILKSGYGMDC